jgi:myo-inositol-1(or 4)-monophosphatase
MRRSALIDAMIGAARKAGRSLVRDYANLENLSISKKGPADLVSSADKKAEGILVADLRKARPKYGFLLEEEGTIEGTDTSNRWVIDPLDGTINFLHAIPHFAISIALERDGEFYAGVVFEPVHDEMFWAEKGQGAFLNGRPLRVSARQHLEDSIISTSIPFKGLKNHALFLRQLEAVMANVSGVRRAGASALDLAYLAAGRYDGFWENGLYPWDIGAGTVLVREAGGYVTQIDGNADMRECTSVLAGNGPIHQRIGEVIRGACFGESPVQAVAAVG